MTSKTAKSAVKDAQRCAKEKALTNKVVSNGARKTIKDIVDFLDSHSAQAAPCLLGLKDGMFDLGEVSSNSDTGDTFASSAVYLRLLTISVIKPILIDLGGISAEAIAKANKFDKKAYTKLFCFVFCDNGSSPTPTRDRDTFVQIYTEWQTVVKKRTPSFHPDGGVDWSKGAFRIEPDAGLDTDGVAGFKIMHISGAEVEY
jgi:hypothetical protein